MVSIVWRRIPTVLMADELLDKAFSRGRKAANAVVDSDKVFRTRKQMTRMVSSAGDVLHSALTEMVKAWPSLDQMSKFDVAMVEAAVGEDQYRKSLGACQWAGRTCLQIANHNKRKLSRMVNYDPMHAARREAYGRIASVMGRIEKDLIFLNEARDTLRELPQIDVSQPCLVVAGAPNVGKSAFIQAVSSGKPDIAAYPFTTQKLHVGHFIDRRIPYQMVDTPGLLDRPMQERNAIEMQAIAALEHVGDLCLFVMDPAEAGGTSWEAQENLMEEVGRLLSIPMLIVDGKGDLIKDAIGEDDWNAAAEMEWNWRQMSESDPAAAATMPIPEIRNPETGHITISATEQVGIEFLRRDIIARIADMREDTRLQLPEGWHRQEF